MLGGGICRRAAKLILSKRIPNFAIGAFMATTWYVKQGEKSFGPYSDDQLKQLVAQGKITPTHHLFNASRQQWMQANQIPGLFSFPSAPQFQSFPALNPNVSAQSSASYRPPVAKKSNTTLVAAGIIGTLSVMGIVAVFALRTPASSAVPQGNSSASAGSTKTNPVPTPTAVATAPVVAVAVPANTFRKELFDKAHRAAVEFRESVGSKPLDTEIKLIENAVKGPEEQEVLKMFKALYDIQDARVQLATIKLSVKRSKEILQELQASRAKAGRPIIPEIDKFIGELEIVSAIDQAGGVPVSSIAKLNLTDTSAMLVETSLITPTEFQGIRIIPYDQARKSLLGQEQVFLKTIGEVINNNGRPLTNGN